MSKQTISVGSAANDGTGTPTRTAFQYVNANFTELYNAVGGSNGTIPSAIPIVNGGTGATTAAAARTNLGLGDAATKTVGTASGNVLQVGAFGLGSNTANPQIIGEKTFDAFFTEMHGKGSGFYRSDDVTGEAATSTTSSRVLYAAMMYAKSQDTALAFWSDHSNRRVGYMVRQGTASATSSLTTGFLRTSNNTSVDGNGFIKAASPILQLFSEKIELNDEAKQQDITFEKLDVGDYVIKGSTGFAQEGWYVEMPKDANGNVLVAVVYEQLENNDISVKTYKKKFDIETASIVADLTQPVDIPEGRWIDLRLQELPQGGIDEP
ncbi:MULTISPECIES: phage tail protein [unclassified Acinetobacter]|uniref:phage tail fiber protein n=1 Tax=unclassified Acinetobacter TaxID=196816 RepID=UPI0025776CA3|nr:MULTISPECIES: phage tail protein [unclassified Acinetobacter]